MNMQLPEPRKLFRVGVIGTVVTALCCFTPILVVLLGVVGLSALTGYLDYVLFPALAAFVGLTVYALIQRRRVEASRTSAESEEKR
ncbi:mercury resistance system transport protein MerF [Methylohalobius crimeensis]|uniref:mercury resistance system transport protein MerF n=1 Tax=Methylohalobius crimeensis TaxID=244365 RepID=UPI0003F78DB3|nr:mercury resistance system transport protein MerF [Methylohalobius crimeensis]